MKKLNIMNVGHIFYLYHKMKIVLKHKKKSYNETVQRLKYIKLKI